MKSKIGMAAAGAVAAALVVSSARHGRPMSLAGKVAVVTGGSRGLGLLIARELVRQGCRVAILARDRGELEKAQALLEELGGEVLALTCDVGDRARVDEAARTVVAHFGGVDLLVNNAGIIQVGPLSAMTHDDFAEAMDVMFWGVLNPILALLPHLKQSSSGGRIVNITSIGAKVGAPHLLPYSSAKFAAAGLSEGLRAELARDGIRVTTVVPGFMRTGSYVNAYFKGNADLEFTLFSIVDNLPLVSMDAERAARRIVLAAARGEAELTLTWPAKLAARMNGLFPGLTADLLGVANRLLPSPDRSTDRRRGAELKAVVPSPIHRRLTAAGRSAGERFNELSASAGNGRAEG